MKNQHHKIPIEDSWDPRRRQELRDSLMINEDHTAMANLPMRAIHAEYKHFGLYSNRNNYRE